MAMFLKLPERYNSCGSDYAQLSEELWHFFHGVYGGGPELMLRPASTRGVSSNPSTPSQGIKPTPTPMTDAPKELVHVQKARSTENINSGSGANTLRPVRAQSASSDNITLRLAALSALGQRKQLAKGEQHRSKSPSKDRGRTVETRVARGREKVGESVPATLVAVEQKDVPATLVVVEQKEVPATYSRAGTEGCSGNLMNSPVYFMQMYRLKRTKPVSKSISPCITCNTQPFQALLSDCHKRKQSVQRAVCLMDAGKGVQLKINIPQAIHFIVSAWQQVVKCGHELVTYDVLCVVSWNMEERQVGGEDADEAELKPMLSPGKDGDPNQFPPKHMGGSTCPEEGHVGNHVPQGQEQQFNTTRILEPNFLCPVCFASWDITSRSDPMLSTTLYEVHIQQLLKLSLRYNLGLPTNILTAETLWGGILTSYWIPAGMHGLVCGGWGTPPTAGHFVQSDQEGSCPGTANMEEPYRDFGRGNLNEADFSFLHSLIERATGSMGNATRSGAHHTPSCALPFAARSLHQIWALFYPRTRPLVDILSSKRKDYTNSVVQPSLSSVEKIIASTDVRCSYGETELSALKNHIKGLSADELLQNGVSYHKKCCKDLTKNIHRTSRDQI
uniref:Uncharacterized protein n=1 Tax=Timema genevievae TaxID=629358 RepID=A0A7R9K5V7_TIMGE|nr:unnamed protein product [Timema genevievae]